MPLSRQALVPYSHSGETADWPLAIRRNRFVLGGQYRGPNTAYPGWATRAAVSVRVLIQPGKIHQLDYTVYPLNCSLTSLLPGQII